MNIVWLNGPSESSGNGVGQYSQSLISEIQRMGTVSLLAKTIPHKARSFRRYFYQFFIYPLILIRLRNEFSVVILYQEDLAFLLPLIKLMGKKVIVIYHHAPDLNSAKSLVEKIKVVYLRLMALSLGMADQIISPSQDAAQKIAVSMGLSADMLSIVYNSFDFKDISGSSSDKVAFFARFGIEYHGHEKVLLNVGTDESRKNLNCFLEGYANIDQCNHVFIKVGKVLALENNEKMLRLILDRGLNAHFLDFITSDDLNTLYEIADVYVSPSVQEGFGRTVIEAQSHGAPVLASKLEVYEEIMQSSYIPVENYTSPNTWSHALETFNYSNSELIQQGKDNAERFCSISIAKDFLDIVEKVESGVFL